tara:strand:- start:2158 stop:3348 length:1191 start_codon:yes stop_codon:yes gene_type:complete
MLTRIFILLLLFYSCSVKDNNHNKNRDMQINLFVNQVYNYSNNLFEVSINHEISNNHFVFIKDDDVFKANILSTMQIYDIDNDSIIIQESWKEELIEKYYESTRSSSKYLLFNKFANLPKGNYHIRVNIQDLDNSNIFKSQKKIDLSAANGFGDLSLYLKTDLNEFLIIKEMDNEFKIDHNQILLSFQYFNDDKKIDELLLELDGPDEKYLEKYSNLSMDDNGFYSIDFVIPDIYYNRFDLILSVSDYSISKSLYLENIDNNFWTNDSTEIISVMRYILPVADIKSMKKLKLSDQFEFINNYWADRDPDSNTLENELLVEFTNRVKFVNSKFSDLGKGWRSDRGRVYIIYGPPEMVERYSNQSDGIYEIWEYPSGTRFTFLDRNGFGQFMLIRKTI